MEREALSAGRVYDQMVEMMQVCTVHRDMSLIMGKSCLCIHVHVFVFVVFSTQ